MTRVKKEVSANSKRATKKAINCYFDKSCFCIGKIKGIIDPFFRTYKETGAILDANNIYKNVHIAIRNIISENSKIKQVYVSYKKKWKTKDLLRSCMMWIKRSVLIPKITPSKGFLSKFCLLLRTEYFCRYSNSSSIIDSSHEGYNNIFYPHQ